MKKMVKKLVKRVKKDKKMKMKENVKLKTKKKMKKVMKEFSEGELHSSSKKGPIVKNPKQAIAIAYSEAKKSRKKKK